MYFHFVPIQGNREVELEGPFMKVLKNEGEG